MSSNNQTKTPPGLYVLSGLAIILSIDLLYVLFSSSSTNVTEIISAVIFIPLLTYSGVGMMKAWPMAKHLFVALAILLFVGSFTQITALFIFEGQGLIGVRTIARAILGLILPPIIYFYLKKEKVKTYFETAT